MHDSILVGINTLILDDPRLKGPIHVAAFPPYTCSHCPCLIFPHRLVVKLKADVVPSPASPASLARPRTSAASHPGPSTPFPHLISHPLRMEHIQNRLVCEGQAALDHLRGQRECGEGQRNRNSRSESYTGPTTKWSVILRLLAA